MNRFEKADAVLLELLIENWKGKEHLRDLGIDKY
jgi:hypothetical protein